MAISLIIALLLQSAAAQSPIWNCGTWCGSSPGTTPTTNTIVDVAVADGRFTQLVAAVTATGLAGDLSGPGPLTVFAPLDSAFANVPAKFVQNAQYRQHLRMVLLYHVVGNARVASSSLTEGMSITTLNGEPINVTDPPPNVELNGSVDVVLPDVDASNGVIHVIDEVLLPSQVRLSILDLALGAPQLRTLSSLLSLAGIANVFGDANASFTVFAPTDAAFAKLPQSLIDTLTDPANVQTLLDVLQFHVVSDAVVLSSQLFVGQPIKSGLTVTSLKPPTVNDSIIGPADILVLIPPSQPSPGFPMPAPAPMPVPSASVVSPLSFNCGTWCQPTPGSSPVSPSFPQPNSFNPPPPSPVFMPVAPNFPTPTSFDPQPTPPAPVGPTFGLPTSFGPPPSPQGPTIVDVAVGDGRFTTLVAAVTNLGLAGTLSGPGPFTVFAPIDEAFEDVPARFLQPGFSEHLRQVLLYHVVGSGAVTASQLSEGQSIPTLAGESVVVTDYELPDVELNGESDVILADVGASNGIIHVIDDVLLPSAVTSTILDRVVASPFLSTLESLLGGAGLAGVFDGTNGEVYTVFAPSNAAFNKLPADLVAQLTNPANVATLQEVLLFHGSVVPSSTLTSGMQIKDGLSVTSLSPIRLNDSVVTSTNILAGNGIVHLIDTVLIPPSLSGSVTNALQAESSAVRSSMLAILGVSALIMSLL